MDRIEFKEKMERDGFTVNEKSMAAGTVNRDHTHPFDARLFVLDGHITIGQGGEEKILGQAIFVASMQTLSIQKRSVRLWTLPILLLYGGSNIIEICVSHLTKLWS